MIAEAHDKDPVLRAQYFLQEEFDVFLMLLTEMVLAAAGIDNQSESQRQVRAFGKGMDSLRHGIFEQLNVVGREVGDELALRVARDEPQVDQVHIDMEYVLRGCRGWRSECTQQEPTPAP